MDLAISIIFLVVLAIISQHIVAWAGSILHEVGNIESNYAVFTFQDDRNQPMTTNIIMNICIPNVFMVFIYMFSHAWRFCIIEQYLMVYIISFYVYRMILICVILRRKEMYSIGYEIGTAFVAISLAYMLNTYFFASVDNVFIGVNELKEELWFAMIVVLYQFMKQILDKKVSQDNVLTKGQISKYIIRKFNVFFEKYHHMLDFNVKTCDMYIFMFSIMIFEDYNRGPISRFFERIKVRLGTSATVGIMQIKSDKPLSDEESIIKFLKWIEDKLDEDNRYLDVMWIRDLAWEYNNDDAYARSVAYIYDCLSNYIDELPKYRKIFCIREREDEFLQMDDSIEEGYEVQQYIQMKCIDTKSFLMGIKDNVYIETDKKQYNLLECKDESVSITWNDVYDGKEVVVSNVKNVYMKGNGAELIVYPRYATVLSFVNCQDIVIDNFKIGHHPGSECAGAVLKFENCKNIHLIDSELYGCGIFGVSSFGSNIYIENCKIYNCTYGALELYSTQCRIKNLEIFDCNNTFRSIISAYESNVVLSNSIIKNCSTDEYIIEAEQSSVIQDGLEIVDCTAIKGVVNSEM